MPHRETISLRFLSLSATRNILVVLFSIELLLVVLDLSFSYADILNNLALQQLFNLAREGSLGSWFSSTQLLLTGAVLWLLFVRFLNDSSTPVFKKYAWALIALFFTFMAIDDAAAIHETIGSTYEDIVSNADEAKDVMGGEILQSYPSYPWQVILGPVFLLMGLFIFIFIWAEVSLRSMRLLLIAALGCYAIAVGLDYVEGVYGGYKTIIVTTGLDYDSVMHISKVIEEFLEMLGTTFFLVLFIKHLAMHTESIEFKFHKP